MKIITLFKEFFDSEKSAQILIIVVGLVVGIQLEIITFPLIGL